jgi:FixJ family two-component response regulator
VKHLPKIFVVDEDPVVVKSIESLLAPQGYDVKGFLSVDEFLAHHHPTQVGCVLVDFITLGVSGRELLQSLRESGSFLSTVNLSGLIVPPEYDDEANEPAMLRDKPYEAATLHTMIADGVAGSFRRRAEQYRRGG